MENKPVKIRSVCEGVADNMSILPYVMMAITGLSVGICIYLYRELSKVKGNVGDMYKDIEMLREKQESHVDVAAIKQLDEKIERLGMFVQQLTKKLFEKEQQVVSPSVNSEEDDCQGGVCVIDATESGSTGSKGFEADAYGSRDSGDSDKQAPQRKKKGSPKRKVNLSELN